MPRAAIPAQRGPFLGGAATLALPPQGSPFYLPVHGRDSPQATLARGAGLPRRVARSAAAATYRSSPGKHWHEKGGNVMDDLAQQEYPPDWPSPTGPSGPIETGSTSPPATEPWQIATDTLREMLEQSDGVVSSRALRARLERRGVENAREMVVKLKLFNFQDSETDLPRPEFQYHHLGRSFYSEQAYARATEETVAAAEKAGHDAEASVQDEEQEGGEVHTKRRNQQDEARLCKYVEQALKNLYDSDYGPDVEIAYDVHNERPGSEFENMDVVAVHWRSDEVVELVGVEVKLDFCPRLVLQAGNYKRFAHRVWVAVPVDSDEPGVELREKDALLFEHVVEEGIGILACRKKRGRAYEAWPIHWPRLNSLDSIARDAFVQRYRGVFEKARVIEPDEDSWHPRLR
jgi:hypothetical protein